MEIVMFQTMKKKIILSLLGVILLIAGCGTEKIHDNGATSIDELREGFADPPQSSRARVWWHWMNGNITKEGILKDLEWMKNSGLGGVHNFDAALATPTIVEKRLVYMENDWKDAFAYAVRMADSLGLEFTIASAPGWSSTGGPWVKPQDAMKKLVWRTVRVSGGHQVDLVMPAPFNTVGAFQNGAPRGRGSSAQIVPFYKDVAVIAVRQPDERKSLEELGAKLSSSGGLFTISQLTDGDIANSTTLPSAKKDGFSWIMYEFPNPVTIKALTVVGVGGGGFGGGSSRSYLESSDDGMNFAKVCDLRGGSVAENTLSIPPTTAKYFRLCVRPGQTSPMGMMFGGGMPSQAGIPIAEFEIFPYSKVNRFEDKAGFSMASHLMDVPTPSAQGETFPSSEDVVDISSSMDSAGTLSWNAPEGNWKIYRFGYSLTGKQNHPATAEATGLEVDKLDSEAWKRYFHAYLDMYKEAAGGMIGEKGIQYVLTDSYEAEHENWTPAMLEKFKSMRGYDLTPWLPVLAGEIIGSPEESDRFLWDWRKTIGDLFAANYDLLTEIAQKDYGMLGRYTEAHEAGRAFVGDGMDIKRTAQVPMSAMWVCAPWLPKGPDGDANRSVYCADDKESSSVAHIYGQNIAAAESMTAWGDDIGYSYHPANLKRIADLELSCGINRFVIHESAHQPVDNLVPGLSLGGIGQWFNRHDAWASMAGVWGNYMARSSFMLQSGKNVADVLYYYGEDSNVTTEFGSRPAAVPNGYEWDYCSPDALLNAISAQKGNLVSAGGTEYKVLYMDRNVDYMSVPVLRKLAELAEAGIVIGGAKPQHPASKSDSQEEFDSLMERIWGSGRSNVFADKSLDEIMKAISLAPDATMPEGMRFLHRTLPSAEVYWINKPSQESETVKVSLRTAGMKPQLWHPDTGVIEDASYSVVGDRTEVTIHMVPDDAVFVVFSGKGQESYAVPAKNDSLVLSLDGPWKVSFQENHGAPEEAMFDDLRSYTESDVPGIKYFSGIASYKKTIALPALKGQAILDLGSVENLAEVFVNGASCGYAWKHPYLVDITNAIKEGQNDLEVKVANVWVNRLIGDAQPDCKEKVTYTDAHYYDADDALIPAGLLGPVTIVNRK